MNDDLKDPLKGWKDFGKSGDGLRRLAFRVHGSRGLESYITKGLHSAAARMDQLEKQIRKLGGEVPNPEERDNVSEAMSTARAIQTQDIRGFSTYIWYEFGDEARKAALEEMGNKTFDKE